jgi:hypothetical protein
MVRLRVLVAKVLLFFGRVFVGGFIVLGFRWLYVCIRVSYVTEPLLLLLISRYRLQSLVYFVV